MVRFVLWLITLYQKAVSPLLGKHCRFTPSCSEYFRGSIERHGCLKGSIFGLLRIVRCHPFHPGGYDPVNPNFANAKFARRADRLNPKGFKRACPDEIRRISSGLVLANFSNCPGSG